MGQEIDWDRLNRKTSASKQLDHEIDVESGVKAVAGANRNQVDIAAIEAILNHPLRDPRYSTKSLDEFLDWLKANPNRCLNPGARSQVTRIQRALHVREIAGPPSEEKQAFYRDKSRRRINLGRARRREIIAQRESVAEKAFKQPGEAPPKPPGMV
jgi:hypothetical protein